MFISEKTPVEEVVPSKEKPSAKKVKPPEEKPTPPKFTKQPKSQTVKENEKVVLECKATGNPAPKLTWYKDETPLTSSRLYKISMKKDKTCVLEISNAGPISPCIYTCRAENIAGLAVTSATITVQGKFFFQVLLNATASSVFHVCIQHCIHKFREVCCGIYISKSSIIIIV